jgi:hypothetical protein
MGATGACRVCVACAWRACSLAQSRTRSGRSDITLPVACDRYIHMGNEYYEKCAKNCKIDLCEACCKVSSARGLFVTGPVRDFPPRVVPREICRMKLRTAAARRTSADMLSTGWLPAVPISLAVSAGLESCASARGSRARHRRRQPRRNTQQQRQQWCYPAPVINQTRPE